MPCIRWMNTGKCAVDGECRYAHVSDGVHTPTEAFPAGLDLKTLGNPKDITCRFHQKGTCTLGAKCKLSHDPPKKSLICARPPEGEWVFDTGTGIDVAGGKLVNAEVKDAVGAPELSTANGTIKPDTVQVIHLDALGEDIEALKLPGDAPKALAVGRRCAQLGYEFWWKPFAGVPLVRRPDGSNVDVACDADFVPYLQTTHSAPTAFKHSVLPVLRDDSEEMLYSILDPYDGPEDADRTPPIPEFGPDGQPWDDDYIGEVQQHQPTLDAIPEDVLSAIDGGDVPEVGDSVIHEFVRALDGVKTKHDDDAHGNAGELRIVDVSMDPGELLMPTKSKRSHLTVHHCTLHLPADPENCPACKICKCTSAYSRRRKIPGVTVQSPDAEARPFGAMFHLDHWELKPGSHAHGSAKAALAILDEKTGFRGLTPTNSRQHLDVVEQTRQYEGVEEGQQARRWWTDCAPEFKAASREIRKVQPLAHFTSPPHRHQANGTIERSNRTVSEGSNASIFTAGFDGKWWVCAAPYWVAQDNGYTIRKDGTTAWENRFGVPCPFKLYPWGALVFVKPPQQLEGGKRKFEPKMLPHVLMSIGFSSGWVWNHTYGVVKLEKLLGDGRGSRACIRHTTDIYFPEVPSFPVKIKLNANGAIGDANLPGPKLADETQPFSIVDDEGSDTDGADDLEVSKPILKSKLFEAIIFDPEDAAPASDDEVQVDIDDAPIIPLPADEVHDGVKVPSGWRIDKFNCPVRQVSVPPWSRRPPSILPETWILTPRKEQSELRAKWQKEDPKGYDTQDARRQAHLKSKQARRVCSAVSLQTDGAISIPPGAPLPIEFADPSDPDAVPPDGGQTDPIADITVPVQPVIEQGGQDKSIKSAAATRSGQGPKVGSYASTSTMLGAQRRTHAGTIEELERTTKEKLLSGKFDRLFLEVCCEESSTLCESVAARTLAVRVTQAIDVTDKRTIKALHTIIRTARFMSLVPLWK
jgi:hypothetical protein